MGSDSKEAMQASLDKTNAALAKRSQKGYTWWGGGKRGGNAASDLKADTAYWGGLEEKKAKAEAGLKALGGEKRGGGMLGLLDTRTRQRQADISASAASRSAGVTQSLARIGMGNTTVGASLQSGVERERQAELRREADSQIGAKLGVMSQAAEFAEAQKAREGEFASRFKIAELGSKAQLGVARIAGATRVGAAKQAALPALVKLRAGAALNRARGVNYGYSEAVGGGTFGSRR